MKIGNGGIGFTQCSRYPYDPISPARRFTLPDQARVAVLVYVNIEHFPFDVPRPAHAVYPGTQHMVPDVLNYGWRDYGNRVGIWRLTDMLGSLGVPISVNLHADVCREYPELIAAGEARGWDWNAQGHTASSILAGMSADEARAVIEDSVAVVEQATGRRPKGWLGSHLAETFETPDLLAEAGLEFVCDYACDDQPFPMRVRSGSMLSMPYTLELNDVPGVLGKGYSAAAFAQMIIDQFDELYVEGKDVARVMPVSLHPFISGHAFRTRHLRRAFEHIRGHDAIWLATCGQLNEHYRVTCGTDAELISGRRS